MHKDKFIRYYVYKGENRIWLSACPFSESGYVLAYFSSFEQAYVFAMDMPGFCLDVHPDNELWCSDVYLSELLQESYLREWEDE